MAKLLVLHGPNLQLLGMREPAQYGTQTLEAINADMVQQGSVLGHDVICFQSDSESVLMGQIHSALGRFDFIIINPAAFTHTSIALRDALLAVAIPFIEVHLSNIYSREPFRHHSYFSDSAQGVVIGFGAMGYGLALQAAHHYLLQKRG